jgi:dihydroneopterin aldolase
VRGIRAWGHHGANPGEQDVAQPFDIDLFLELDLSAARTSDDLADTVNYAELHAAVARIVARERFALLERLGETILDAVMHDVRIARARVAIAKPQLLAGATPVVTVHRER